MERGYQYGFSDNGPAMFDHDSRQRKAVTMVRVLTEALHTPPKELALLNVGGSAGIIDEYLSRHFGQVTSIDIDDKAIAYAQKSFRKNNLVFEIGDAMAMRYAANSFDVVVCSQVYEHVPDAQRMFDEIYRVLKPRGLVYFAAGNRLMLIEPHYDLPLLSVLPRWLAHQYVRWAKRGDHYYEKHYTRWGLKKLVRQFRLIDYTRQLIVDPERYGTDYMIAPGSGKQKIASLVARYLNWMVPGYIWVLEKPEPFKNGKTG